MKEQKETVEAKQEPQCGGQARFIGFREECEVSNSSLVFCPQHIILLSETGLRGAERGGGGGEVLKPEQTCHENLSSF